MKKIGLFDSGIGGFSILKDLMGLNPSLSFYYIADEAFLPYGEKSEEFIRKRCEKVVEVLIEKDVDLIVVACNTATALGIQSLRERFCGMPFVGVEPYLNIVNQGEVLSSGCKTLKPRRLAALITPSTKVSPRFVELKKRVDPKGEISIFDCKNLANIVEELYSRGNSRELERRLRLELGPLKGLGFTHVILGCTHYPLVQSFIEKELGCQCISPGPYVAKRVEHLLDGVTLKKSGSCVARSGNSTFQFLSTKSGAWDLRKFSDFTLLS